MSTQAPADLPLPTPLFASTYLLAIGIGSAVFETQQINRRLLPLLRAA